MPIAIFENHTITPICLAALIVLSDHTGVFETISNLFVVIKVTISRKGEKRTNAWSGSSRKVFSEKQQNFDRRGDWRHVEEVETCSLFLDYTAECRGSSLHNKSSNAYQGSKFDAGSHVFREVWNETCWRWRLLHQPRWNLLLVYTQFSSQWGVNLTRWRNIS